MSVYYNEFEPYAAEWLRNLIKAGHIPDGEVDTRSIVDVEPADLRGFAQCHFFSGIGGWSHALRLAGWADDREIWTGSCPCQPFSVAGKGAGTGDPRHLWPHFFRLIRACRPSVVMGEQVAGKAGYGWFDGVRSDLEGEGYASRAVDIPACAVNAPHIRQRLYWVARSLGDANGARADAYAAQGASRPPIGERGGGIDVGDAYRTERETRDVLTFGDATRPECFAQSGSRGDMADAESIGRRGRPHNEDEGRRELAFADPCEGSGDVADAYSQRPQGQRADSDTAGRRGSDVSASGLCDGTGNGDVANANGRDAISEGLQRSGLNGLQSEDRRDRRHSGNNEWATFWSHAEWATGADGKTRRVGCQIRRLSYGFSASMGEGRNEGGSQKEGETLNGSASFSVTGQDMSDVRQDIQQGSLRENFGGCDRISEKEVLQHQLRGRQGECEGQNISSESAEVPRGEVRDLRVGGTASRSPHRPQHTQQRPVKPSDVVCFLSSEIALGDWKDGVEEAIGLQYLWEALERVGALPQALSEVPEVWKSMPDETRQRVGDILCEGGLVWQALPLLSVGQKNRVGMLRGFGNAIVPPLAAEVIRAFMETHDHG